MSSLNPVRIRLRYADLDTFVEKFAPNVTRGGVFLATRNHQAVGSSVTFEIQLATGQVALAGEGTVTWVREWDPAEPRRPHGMGVRFVSIDARTQPILARLLRLREASGSGPAVRRTTAPVPILPETTSGAHFRAPAVDTAVDLAVEFGVDPSIVRSLIERSRMTGLRSDEELADLRKPEPVEAVSLSQALTELSRLLDPTPGRRRSTTGLRPLDPPGRSAGEATTSAIPLAREDDITDMTLAASPASGDRSGPKNDVAARSFVEAIHEVASSKSHSHQ